MMPEMSGPHLAQQVSGSRPETKVLYVSGYTEQATVQQGLLAPGTAFLQKPFTPGALGSKIREVLES